MYRPRILGFPFRARKSPALYGQGVLWSSSILVIVVQDRFLCPIPSIVFKITVLYNGEGFQNVLHLFPGNIVEVEIGRIQFTLEGEPPLGVIWERGGIKGMGVKPTWEVEIPVLSNPLELMGTRVVYRIQGKGKESMGGVHEF